MTSYSDASIVRLPSLAETGADGVSADPVADLRVPLVEPSRRSVATLTVLALVAGIAALALGMLAVVLASTSREALTPQVAASGVSRASPTAAVERRALALLSKPSTERIAFRGSRGELVLAVGSGGKAVILVRGIEHAPAERPYHAWIVGAGTPLRVARFTGAEHAVFLGAPVSKGASVAVATERASALRPGPGRLLATRG